MHYIRIYINYWEKYTYQSVLSKQTKKWITEQTTGYRKQKKGIGVSLEAFSYSKCPSVAVPLLFSLTIFQPDIYTVKQI